MNGKRGQGPTDEDDASLGARPPRGGNISRNIKSDDQTADRIRRHADDEPAGETIGARGEEPGREIVPSVIHTVARDVLLPYQVRWIADDAAVKVCEKSRRVGITWSEAADRALSAASKTGMDTWYIGYNKDMALEFVETAAGWAREFDRVARAIEEIAVDRRGARHPRLPHPLRVGKKNRRASRRDPPTSAANRAAP